MSAPGHVSLDHRHDGLGQACSQVVCLDNQRRATLRRSQVRVRKQDQNDITASAVHRRQPFQVDPSLQKTQLGGAADRRPATRRSHVHQGPPALLNEPTSRRRANLRPPPAAPIAQPSRCGRSLRRTSPYTSVSRPARSLVQGLIRAIRLRLPNSTRAGSPSAAKSRSGRLGRPASDPPLSSSPPRLPPETAAHRISSPTCPAARETDAAPPASAPAHSRPERRADAEPTARFPPPLVPAPPILSARSAR